jgi:hypothetical protein
MSNLAIYEENRVLYKFDKTNKSIKNVPTDIQQIPFDDQSYDFGQTMTASFSTGKYFVDTEKSYVNLEVELTGNGVDQFQANWGYGSANNLWRSVRIYHNSGTLISHADNIDLWKKSDDVLGKDAFWFDTIGFIQGYRPSPTTDAIWDSTAPQARSFKIKLSELHPFFKGQDHKLCPPEIINDLRIELDINQINRAIFQIAGPALTARVSSCDLQCAVVEVMDAAQDAISDMANKEGLSWGFSDLFITTKQVAQNENNINIQVDKAVSMAQKVMTFARPSNADTATTIDSYQYTPMSGGISWNYRINNTLYPYKRAVANRFDSYTTAVDCYSWNHGHNMTYSEFEQQNHVYLTCLKTEDHIQNSGEYLNANKTIEIEISKNTSQSDRLVHVALQFNKLLTANSVNSRCDE